MQMWLAPTVAEHWCLHLGNRAEKNKYHYTAVPLSSNETTQLNRDCIVSDVQTDFYLPSTFSCIPCEIITYYYQAQSAVES